MKAFLSLIIVLFSSATMAQELTVLSRNMPRSCEYVFTVETDLRIELPLTSQDEEVLYELQNSWEHSRWTETKKLVLKPGSSTLIGDLTFVSMSIPEKYLYRVIALTFPKAKLKCTSEFGREFGEACKPGGRNETPWRVRQYNCQKLP